MPRITKRLPPDRADYSFGDLVYWHLFKFGTRPSGDPTAKAGRVWEIDAICDLLDITPRTLRNWIADKHLPDTVMPLSTELFGDNTAWDEARLELQAKFEEGWAAKRQTTRPTQPAAATSAEPPPIDAGSTPPNGSAGPTGQADGPPPRRDREQAEGPEQKREGPQPSRAVQPRQPERLRPLGTPEQVSRHRSVRAYIALVAVILGTFAWVQLTRKSEPSDPTHQKTASKTPPAKTEPPAVQVTAKTPEPNLPAPPAAVPIPAVPEPSPPAAETRQAVVTPPPVPTEEERRAAEEKRLTEKLITARQAAHDLEVRRREEEARRLDGERTAAYDRQRELENDARTVAGIGYRLRENTAVAGRSFRYVLTDNVADCALACVTQSCDAFAWYRDQHGPGSRRKRYCYLYRQPIVTANNPGYALGEPLADPPALPSTASFNAQPPVRLAQAGPPAATTPADDLTRCAGGPVKVTGFKLTCDRILSGGTTLGSAQLSYTVANINECAAKCRPIARCVGFTFNSGDTPGKHSCVLFGPTPEGRESKGWISGVR